MRIFIRSKEFLIMYGIVVILDFTVPFFLPSRIVGPYLFWVALSVVVVIYGTLTVKRR